MNSAIRYGFFILACILVLQNRLLSQPGTPQLEQERARALQLLSHTDTIRQSIHWPHVTPKSYFENVKKNISSPLLLSTGSGTNFCAFGAVSYTSLMNEPERYATCMVDLYIYGEALYRHVRLSPSRPIKEAAGTLTYQGSLDKRPADQVWFLTLADRFKGYLNIFNLRYHPGDENTMWAATNLAKFNRMLRRLCKYKIGSHGFDIIRPGRRNLTAFFTEKLKQGEVYLYLNNTILRRKTHNRIRQKLPSHYVVLLALTANAEGLTSIQYWDGEYRTIKELTSRQLRQVLFGYSWGKYKEKIDE